MKAFWGLVLILAVGAGLFMWNASSNAQVRGDDLMDTKPEGYPSVTLAGGCFWCTESEYRARPGVLYTRVGYMGGTLDDPSYQDITKGDTGHAEVVEVTFDPDKTSFEDILDFFFRVAHDPTQLNRQGPNTGTQYRSAIFYQDEAQKEAAAAKIKDIEASGAYDKPIVTKLEPASKFWEAEDYHQRYYEKYEAKTGQPHINDFLKRQRRAVKGE